MIPSLICIIVFLLIGCLVLNYMHNQECKTSSALEENIRISESQLKIAIHNESVATEHNHLFFKNNCELKDKINAQAVRNCELIDKINSYESQPQYDTAYRIGAHGSLTFIGMNQGQYLYAPTKDLNHHQWIIVKKDKPMEDLIEGIKGIDLNGGLDPATATDTEMHLLETLGYRDEDVNRLEAENTDLKEHLQKAMDWIVRIQEPKKGRTMPPVIPFLRPDLVSVKSYIGLVQVEEDPLKHFTSDHGIVDLVRIEPMQWGAKEYHQYWVQTDGFKQPFQKLPTN